MKYVCILNVSRNNGQLFALLDGFLTQLLFALFCPKFSQVFFTPVFVYTPECYLKRDVDTAAFSTEAIIIIHKY